MRLIVVVVGMAATIVSLAAAAISVLMADLHLVHSYIRTIAECILDKLVSFHRTKGWRREEIVSQEGRDLRSRQSFASAMPTRHHCAHVWVHMDTQIASSQSVTLRLQILVVSSFSSALFSPLRSWLAMPIPLVALPITNVRKVRW
jgi:hypothetical protein